MKHDYSRRVQFADTDAAGVVHFSRLLCFVEEAEHDLLGELGIPLMEGGGWPRVHVSCDYLAPLRMGAVAEVEVSPVELGQSSVSWSFVISSGGTEVARGAMKTVRVDGEGKAEGLRVEWREALAGGD